MIYLDNAATSWPKPEVVYDAVSGSIRRGGNPGRGNSEKAQAAATDINAARAALAELFHVPDLQQAREFAFNVVVCRPLSGVPVSLRVIGQWIVKQISHGSLPPSHNH